MWGCVPLEATPPPPPPPMVDYSRVKEGSRRSSRVAQVQREEAERKKQEEEERRKQQLEQEDEKRRIRDEKKRKANAAAGRAGKRGRSSLDDCADGVEEDGSEGEEEEEVAGESNETDLRCAWEFAAVVHWCRIFGDSMRLPKFSSDALENALQQPTPAQLSDAKVSDDGGDGSGAANVVHGTVIEDVQVDPLVSELVLKLVKSGLVSEKARQEEIGEWEGKLFRKLERYKLTYEMYSIFPNGNPMSSTTPGSWLQMTPLQRVRVIYFLCSLRCEECAFVRDAIKRTVDNLEYTADALRNEPIGIDNKGMRYYTFAHMGEDCYMYREKRPAAGRHGGRVRWETVATTMEEVKELAEGFRTSKSRNEKDLYQYITSYHIPQLEETALERERQQKRAEKQLEISLMPRKRSSRIARNELERAEMERVRIAAEEEEKRMAEIRRRELLQNARETRRYRRGPEDGDENLYAQNFQSSKSDRSQRRAMREAGITDDHIRRTLTNRGFYSEVADDDLFEDEEAEEDPTGEARGGDGDDRDDEASEEYVAEEEEEEEDDDDDSFASDEEFGARRKSTQAKRTSGRKKEVKVVFSESDEEDDDGFDFSEEDEEEEGPMGGTSDEENDGEDHTDEIMYRHRDAEGNGKAELSAVPKEPFLESIAKSLADPGNINRTASIAMTSVKNEDCRAYQYNGSAANDHVAAARPECFHSAEKEEPAMPAAAAPNHTSLSAMDNGVVLASSRVHGETAEVVAPVSGVSKVEAAVVTQPTASRPGMMPQATFSQPSATSTGPILTNGSAMNGENHPLAVTDAQQFNATLLATRPLAKVEDSNGNGDTRRTNLLADSVHALPTAQPEAKRIKIVMSRPPPPPPAAQNL